MSLANHPLLLRKIDDLAAGDGGSDADALRRLNTFLVETPIIKNAVTPAPDQILGNTEGVSVVTCCKNRNENLVRALPSWLRHNEVKQVVIVDWDSDFPVMRELDRCGIHDDRILIVRAENEERWILSYAFNLGFRFASHRQILKADADIVISDNFFKNNTLKAEEYIAGDWREAEDGQEFINGFFYVHTADLGKIGGFSEYITTYGWDDDDLYERLDDSGLRRTLVDLDTLNHLDHDDEARMSHVADPKNAWEELQRNTYLSIRKNKIISLLMPKWDEHRRLAPFDVTKKRAGLVYVKRNRSKMPHVVREDIAQECEIKSAMQLLSWRVGPELFDIPTDEFLNLVKNNKMEDINRQNYRELATLKSPLTSGKKSIITPRKKLFVDAQHGLGNRLRAIGSAAAIADKTDRELVIVWEPDHHCDCRFTDLFRYVGAVIEGALLNEASRSEDFDIYNYMEIEEGSEKGKEIITDSGSEIYARSAYVLNHGSSDWDTENIFLKSLRPTAEVLELMESVRTKNDVSVHVRMASGQEYEHLSYESVSNWTQEGHNETERWRKKSHYSKFIDRIRSILDENSKASIYFAADLPEAYDAFQNEFGSNLAHLQRDVFDRSKEQLIYALADAYLLGTSPLLLGSTWSSFSELALRLSSVNERTEMSGVDF